VNPAAAQHGGPWFELRIQPVPEGVCVYSVDIHTRKVKELALALRVAELESRTVLDAIRHAFLGR
jgi:hypothetical protein